MDKTCFEIQEKIFADNFNDNVRWFIPIKEKGMNVDYEERNNAFDMVKLINDQIKLIEKSEKRAD